MTSSAALPATPPAGESTAPPPPVAPAPARPKRRRWRWILALAVILALLAAAGTLAALWTWPGLRGLILPPPSPIVDVGARQSIAQLRDELDRVQQRLAERPAAGPGDLSPSVPPSADPVLAGRVQALEGKLAALAAAPAPTARLDDAVKGLDGRLGTVEKTMADAATVLRLSDRLDKAEAELRAVQAQRASGAAVLLAVTQLRLAVDQALPYDTELRAVAALAPQDDNVARDLAQIQPRAATGIPPRPILTDRYLSLEPAIVRAEALPAGQGWWRTALDRLASLVLIRREDGAAAGNSAAAVTARIRARLAANDLAAAVTEADALTAGPAETIAPWLADARARLTTDAALSDLSAHVIATLGARP